MAGHPFVRGSSRVDGKRLDGREHLGHLPRLLFAQSLVIATPNSDDINALQQLDNGIHDSRASGPITFVGTWPFTLSTCSKERCESAQRVRAEVCPETGSALRLGGLSPARAEAVGATLHRKCEKNRLLLAETQAASFPTFGTGRCSADREWRPNCKYASSCDGRATSARITETQLIVRVSLRIESVCTLRAYRAPL